MKGFWKYALALTVIAAATVVAPQVESYAGKVVRSKSYSYSAASSVGVRSDTPVIDGDDGGGSCGRASYSEACDTSQTFSRTRTRTRTYRAKEPRLRRSRAVYEGCDVVQSGASGSCDMAQRRVYQNAAPISPPADPPNAPAPPVE